MARNIAKARNPACLKIANELIRLAALGTEVDLSGAKSNERSNQRKLAKRFVHAASGAAFSPFDNRRRPNLEGQGQTPSPGLCP